MANIKISALPVFTEASGLDKVPVVDVSAGDTKAYTIEQLLSGNYSISGNKIYTGSATWTNKDYIMLPIGTTAERPASPLNGMIRYNSSSNTYEVYKDGWTSVVIGNSGVAPVASTVTLTADNTTNSTQYPLFSDTATGDKSPRTDTGFIYNPSTGTLTALTFSASGTGALKLPVGTTAQRPTAVTGYLRYNTTLNIFEGYSNSQWGQVGGGQMYGNAQTKVISYNAKLLSENVTILGTHNASAIGPITIDDTATITVEDGATFVVI